MNGASPTAASTLAAAAADDEQQYGHHQRDAQAAAVLRAALRLAQALLARLFGDLVLLDLVFEAVGHDLATAGLAVVGALGARDAVALAAVVALGVDLFAHDALSSALAAGRDAGNGAGASSS